MLVVRAIKKYHDEKGNLIGYAIQNENNPNEIRDIHKDVLKEAVASGKCQVVNMTLTSDGRLLGKACKKPVAKKKQLIGRRAVKLYTKGKHLIGVLVDEREWNRQLGINPPSIIGIENGFTFDVGHEAEKGIEQGEYDNIKIVDGKIEHDGTVGKQTSSAIKKKLVKLLIDNQINYEVHVEKTDTKYTYRIIIDNYDKISNKTALIHVIFILIEDELINNKLKALYIDEDSIYCKCLTGINDVRKVAKNFNKIAETVR